MIPTTTLDPSSPWSKLRRLEVVRLAHSMGHTDITEHMAKNDAVALLLARGVKSPTVPPGRSIGKDFNSRAWDTNIERDFPLSTRPPAPKAEPKLGYNEMRAELKAAGVKLDRKWSKADVTAQWEKLKNGQ